MTPLPLETRENTETARQEPKDADKQPQPWTAPDFVERRVCAEIGAYSFAEG
jgi:coenzyme PQQ precursor peptide PqqA